MREPQVVRTPWVQKMSWWAIGTPVSAPALPAASARSAAAASLSACSRVTEMNALSVAWLASIRARNARTSSTLENFRARRSAASCASVPVCQPLTPASLDDLGNEVQASGDLGRVRLIVLVAVLLAHHVRPQTLRQAPKRMGHRGAAGGVGSIQGANEVGDPRQAVLVHREPVGGGVEPPQGGQGPDLFSCEGHGRFAARVAK